MRSRDNNYQSYNRDIRNPASRITVMCVLPTIALVMLIWVTGGFAQEPRANASPTPMVTPTPEVKLPAVVPLSVDDSKAMLDMNKDLIIIQQRAKIIELEITRLQRDYQDLVTAEKDKMTQRVQLVQPILKKAGVPEDKIGEYEGVDPLAGSNIYSLKLRTPPKK